MLYVMFIIRGISLVDTKTAIYVTYRYRSNSIAFEDVFKVRIIWEKIRAKLIINITAFKKVFFFIKIYSLQDKKKASTYHRKGDGFAKT